jgi:hypothetical protein
MCSVVVYVTLVPLVALSLSVPPGDLLIFIAMSVAAACAWWSKDLESRRWRVACLIGLVFAVLGGILELVSGLLK